MPSDNHQHSRELQQDARAWARFTNTNYTAALRQMTSPLAQGLLGHRVSARDLIAVLDEHPLVGADDGLPLLSDNGYYDDTPWMFNGRTDFIELAMVIDMLRMFTSTPPDEELEVSSYSLKHTAEEFLAPHCTYVSNGRLIWAAAALDLPMVESEGGNLNLLIGVSEREHDYVSRTVRDGHRRPQAHHYQPAAFTFLVEALNRAADGEFLNGPWLPPTVVPQSAPFHDWLVQQAPRPDPVGHFAFDYAAGVRDSDHRAARTPAGCSRSSTSSLTHPRRTTQPSSPSPSGSTHRWGSPSGRRTFAATPTKQAAGVLDRETLSVMSSGAPVVMA